MSKRHFSFGMAAGLFVALLFSAFRAEYEAAHVTEAIVLERAPQIRKLYTPNTPSAEECRAQGKQWVAYRNPDNWAWVRACVPADLSQHYRPTKRGSHGKEEAR